MNVFKRNYTKSQTLVSSLKPIPSYNDETTLASVGYTPITDFDPCGQLLVVYVANGQTSVISLIGLKNVNTSQYDIKNVKRFNENGPVAFDGSTNEPVDSTYATSDGIMSSVTGTSSTAATSGTAKSGDGSIDMDDYLLKTQIIPPVCPSCPSCPQCELDSTICHNCGGQGGSGTVSDKGNTLVNNTDPNTDPLSSTVKVAGNVANTAIETTGDVATNVVDTAVDVTGAAASGVGKLASPVVDAAGNVVSGAGSAIYSGAEQVGGAVGGLFESDPTNVNAIGQNGSAAGGPSPAGAPGGAPGGADANGVRGTPNNGARFDVYSHYGQLEQQKPSSYMPLTADFSAFSK